MPWLLVSSSSLSHHFHLLRCPLEDRSTFGCCLLSRSQPNRSSCNVKSFERTRVFFRCPPDGSMSRRMALVSGPMPQIIYRQDCRRAFLLEVSGNCLFLAWVRRVAVNSAQPGMNDRRIRCLIFRGRKSDSSVTSIKRHFEPSPADGPVRLSERLSFGNPMILFDFNLHLDPASLDRLFWPNQT